MRWSTCPARARQAGECYHGGGGADKMKRRAGPSGGRAGRLGQPEMLAAIIWRNGHGGIKRGSGRLSWQQHCVFVGEALTARVALRGCRVSVL